jgi:uncharacterized membrane protein YbhN (UPF0104 family)
VPHNAQAEPAPTPQGVVGASAPEEEHDDSLFDMRRIGRRIGLFVIVAAVVAVLFATLPGVSEVRERLRTADPTWIAVAGIVSLGSVLSFVAALLGAFDRVVPARRGLTLGLAEQGANVLLPAGGTGGPALGTFVMRRAGVPTDIAAERHVALFLITSAVGFVSLALFGSLEAIGLLPGDAHLVGTLLPAAAGVVVILGVAALARGEAGPEPDTERRIRHGVWRLRGFLRDGVRTSLLLLREGDVLLIGGAIAYYGLDIAALGACFQAFGGGGPPIGIFILAYTIGHAGAFIPTPGGVGGTDGGLIGMFAAYGAPLDLATAAVLSYRVFQLGLPAILGALSLVKIRNDLRTTDNRATVAARFAALEHGPAHRD